MDDEMRKKEAKYYRDKGVIERSGKTPQQALHSYRILGVDPENIDRMINEKEECDKKQILSDLKRVFMKYIDTSENNYKLLSHWVVGTYFHSQFETYPILQINARKRSGKSRTLKLCSILSKDGDGSTTTSPTEALLFRNKDKPIFFDELESINSKERQTFRETLNTIYKKGNCIRRYREAKDKNGKNTFEEEKFYPFYPLGLANINGLNDVLEDRAIQIILQRSDKPATMLIEDYSTNKEILDLKDNLNQMHSKIPQNLFSEWNCYIQNEKYNPALEKLFEKIKKSEVKGRQLEIFFPLFVVAYLCKDLDDFIVSVKEYLMTLEGDYVDNGDDLLQEFITKHQLSYFTGFVKIKTILNDFRASIEDPEEWINSKWLGKALKRLGFVASKRYVNGCVEVRLKLRREDREVELVDSIELKGLKDEDKEICSKCENQAILIYNNKKLCSDCYRNSTNTTYTTNSTNSTNSTKDNFSNGGKIEGDNNE